MEPQNKRREDKEESRGEERRDVLLGQKHFQTPQDDEVGWISNFTLFINGQEQHPPASRETLNRLRSGQVNNIRHDTSSSSSLETPTSCSNWPGCQVLFQDGPLALRGLQLYILLLQHRLKGLSSFGHQDDSRAGSPVTALSVRSYADTRSQQHGAPAWGRSSRHCHPVSGACIQDRKSGRGGIGIALICLAGKCLRCHGPISMWDPGPGDGMDPDRPTDAHSSSRRFIPG
ncbi:hypothetical protein EYF80_012222 [Liparis tanakae]|uniref:Uncharacterized protein n=1 Tax=Liparis tanakae TaxID=230148 RepID=A0A4Z2IK35_9TELE|nr:hypothetical protein EYF80_012222 [Liparis tanakae]